MYGECMSSLIRGSLRCIRTKHQTGIKIPQLSQFPLIIAPWFNNWGETCTNQKHYKDVCYMRTNDDRLQIILQLCWKSGTLFSSDAAQANLGLYERR